MTKVQFLQGLYNNLPSSPKNNTFYFTTDTKELFFGYDNSLIKISLPMVTSTETGSFLRVNSEGNWNTELLDNAEELSY